MKMCSNAPALKLPVPLRSSRLTRPAIVLNALPAEPPILMRSGAAALNNPPVNPPITAPVTPASKTPLFHDFPDVTLLTTCAAADPTPPESAPIPIALTRPAPGPSTPTIAPEIPPATPASNNPLVIDLPCTTLDTAWIPTPTTAPMIAPASAVHQGQH